MLGMANFSLEGYSDVLRMWAEIWIRREDKTDISAKDFPGSKSGKHKGPELEDACVTGVREAGVLVTMGTRSEEIWRHDHVQV